MSLDRVVLHQRLDRLAAAHQVVGASLAVLCDDHVTEVATGLLNIDTGVDVTTDTVFQTGSITKVWTATVALQLVDEGLIDLDEPIVRHLPEFRVGDPETGDRVTLRHLLSHTSGIEGDHFRDTGRGDDCLARYVDSCADLPQVHPLGATMSYCNTGYSIVGRLVERMRGGSSWDRVLTERVIEPLGLARTTTMPEDVLRFRAALGHVGDADKPGTSPVWGPPRSAGPAGLVCATAAEVVTFAKMHLDDGVGPSGTRVLSTQSVQAMQTPQVAVPDRWTLGGDSWGLGWSLLETDEGRVYGHDGSTFGQRAFLRVAPDARVAIALLTTGGRATELFQSLGSDLLHELAGITIPARPRPGVHRAAGDAAPLAGTYERPSTRLEVTANGSGTLHLRVTDTSDLAGVVSAPTRDLELLPVRPGLFVTRLSDRHAWMPAVFYELDDGRPYIHFSGRATPRRPE